MAARMRGIVCAALLLAGCATSTLDSISTSRFPAPVELTGVPFFPQEAYHCGPAALATVLQANGIAATPASLAPQVYLPARRGSLQLELLGAARRHGAIAYVIEPKLEHVLTEVAAGHPVVVLQNLAFGWYPKWHYAVVVGFDVERRELVLRSGAEKRHVVAFALFERTWRRAERWAMVALPPGRLPETAEETRYLRAVLALERLRQWEATDRAYRSAIARWPRSFAAHLGLGNSRYALGDYAGAEAAFRAALPLRADPGFALNNLALTLAAQQRWSEAEAAAQQALAHGGTHRGVYESTLARIRARTEPVPAGRP